MDLPITIYHEKLINALDSIYPKLDVRSIKSPDFSLSKKELYFKLGQRSVVDNLIQNLNQLKKGGN